MEAAAKAPSQAKAAAEADTSHIEAGRDHQPINPVWATLALGAQAKLTVSAPDDPFEREADSVADRVMRMPEPKVQRKCDACSEQQTSKDEDEHQPIVQRRAESFTQPAQIRNDFMANLGLGQPLGKETKGFFEPRFGTNFDSVRVHSGHGPAESARSINALAYTLGNDIVFASGQYRPNETAGKRLLAHELTHVLQNSQGGDQNQIKRACGSVGIGNPSGCIGNSMQLPARPRYLFHVGCDDFLEGNELDLRSDAVSITNDETVEIHGLASEEGTDDFNIRLSCARALRARMIVEEVLRERGISARIVVYSHGPQEGEREVNRSVLVIRHPPEIVPPPEENPEPPASVPMCSGIYTDGRNETSDPDHDLDQIHHSGERSPDIILYDNVGGETGARIDFWTGFFGGTMFESTTDDDTLYNHFTTGTGSRLNFNTATDMASIIGRSPTFTSFADTFELSILSHISTTGTLCGFDGNTYLSTHRPAYFHSPLFAWAVMGGYSRIDASVTQPPGGGISVTYKIYDHYGAGVSDAWSYLLGLSALYYLQHFHGIPGSKYTPYIWSVEIARSRV